MAKRTLYIPPIDERSTPIESNGEIKHWVNAGMRSGYYETNLLPPLHTGEKQ